MANSSSKNSFKKVSWVAGIIILILLIWNVFTPSYRQPAYPNVLAYIIGGLIAGALIMFLIWRLTISGKQQQVIESSHTVVESIRKVFKIVCAEGQLNELYNYEETKKIFGFIPSTKKVLVIIKAKVLIGFDFEKCVWEADESKQTIKLMSFPTPEILSIEPEYQYYNFDEGIFNLVNRNDLTIIQTNGKKLLEEAAINSDLPRIAAEQMRTILTEVVESKHWHLENSSKITALTAKKIDDITATR